MINGVTKIVMTKADVLDAFTELQVCTDYEINGKTSREIPFRLEKAKIDPIYKSFKGWDSPSALAKTAGDLPGSMNNYVDFINKYLGVNIHYISNGPGRDQLIHLY